MELLKTVKPKEMGGREREGLAGCCSGCSSVFSMHQLQSESIQLDCCAGEVAARGGESQNTSLSLETSSLFTRSAETAEKFIFSSSNTTLPAG